METKDNKEIEDTFAMINLLCLTACVLLSLSNIRHEAREAYIEWISHRIEDQQVNSMMLRTMMLQGRLSLTAVPESFELDPRPITQFFQASLMQHGSQGEVKACIVEPDLAEFCKIENEKQKLMLRRFMFKRYPPGGCMSTFASKAYLEQGAFEEELLKHEISSQKFFQEQIYGSNTAFIVFDSIETLQMAQRSISNKYLQYVSNTVGIPLDSMYSKIKTKAGTMVSWSNPDQMSALQA